MKRHDLPQALRNPHIKFDGTLREGSYGAFPKGSTYIAVRLGLPAHFMLAAGQTLLDFDPLKALKSALHLAGAERGFEATYEGHSLPDATVIIGMPKDEFNKRANNNDILPDNDPFLAALGRKLLLQTEPVLTPLLKNLPAKLKQRL